ncbi:hypothetical protein U9M48_035465 [Paspalum notatum var. saurae]|uniref:Uncharacterized protein n=1 Tax=Paspalum notatum var. saurae TaxID=547442 RepID=A0AAQ3X7T3_PASNO
MMDGARRPLFQSRNPRPFSTLPFIASLHRFIYPTSALSLLTDPFALVASSTLPSPNLGDFDGSIKDEGRIHEGEGVIQHSSGEEAQICGRPSSLQWFRHRREEEHRFATEQPT